MPPRGITRSVTLQPYEASRDNRDRLRNPWGFLPQKPFPIANSSTGCTPLAFGERRFTRGYIPLPHPGQTRKDRKERGHFMRLNGYLFAEENPGLIASILHERMEPSLHL